MVKTILLKTASATLQADCPFQIETMKTSPFYQTLLLSFLFAGCATTAPLTLDTATVVEAACGECKLGMAGKSCDLAIRVNGHKYFVDGVKDSAVGDQHAADGICSMVRKARVTGAVKNGRFVATSFELLPVAGK